MTSNSNSTRGPDPWTAIPNNTDTTPHQRRRAAIHVADVMLTLGTTDELATYLPMLFTEQELEEMGL